MVTQKLQHLARERKSLLCIGLDPEATQLPHHFSRDAEGVRRFNSGIIAATLESAIAYKPNLAFYEGLGSKGWDALAHTVETIGGRAVTVADAKRGDIGNTARQYAKVFFEDMGFDAVTVNPYMGLDTLEAFLSYPGKLVFVLGLTSNPGAADFELDRRADGRYFFENVIERIARFAEGAPAEVGFVAGATRGELLASVRTCAPKNWLLVPGIGAQGGSLGDVITHCLRPDYGILVNSSRAILYAGNGPDYAERAAEAARKAVAEMRVLVAF